MDIGDASPVSVTLLKKIEDLFKPLPPLEEQEPGDLSGLGRMLDVCERAQRVSEEWPTAAGVFGIIRTEIERYMLDDVSDPVLTREYLTKSLQLLKNLTAQPDPQSIFTDLSKVLIPAKDVGLIARDPANDQPAMGVLNILGNEDKVIYAEFVGESLEHLERIEGHVLGFEQGARSIEITNDIFRCFHSIKGAAGFLGLTALNRLCHECETMLDRVRKNSLRPDAEVVETLLSAIDYCRRMLNILHDALEAAKNGDLPAFDIRPLLGRLRLILQRPVVLMDAEAEPGRIGGLLVEKGVIDDEQLANAIEQQRRPIGKILVDMGAATERQIEDLAGGVPDNRKSAAIKVDTERLDNLLEMVGELVIAHAQVENDGELRTTASPRSMRNIANVGKITAGLQELVMSLRLVPLRATFNKMFRLVRDTSHKTGKEVELILSGEETEIDKTLIEKLADPLVHLLRNAVDHGIEKPEVRTAAGKKPVGRVQLRAFHAGGNVVIEIEDDGGGIDADKVLNKAHERGLIPADAVFTDREKLELIFLPGVSTNEVATDISGRGVGMDVVKRNITAIGGRVETDSLKGKGTKFTIKLPLTMAIVDGIVVTAGDQRYVLPTLSIEETVKPAREEIVEIAGGKGRALQARGMLIPVVSLHSLFDLGAPTEPWDGMVVVAQDNGVRCGLVIDEMLVQQQVVVKSLGNRLTGVTGISGGCILGDGRVGLILDIPGILELSSGL